MPCDGEPAGREDGNHFVDVASEQTPHLGGNQGGDVMEVGDETVESGLVVLVPRLIVQNLQRRLGQLHAHTVHVLRFLQNFVYSTTRREQRLKSHFLHLRRLKKRKVFEPVKGGPFGLFENPVRCKISNKLKGDPLETKKSKII